MRLFPLAVPLILLSPLLAHAADGSFTGRFGPLEQHVLEREATFPAEPTPEEARRLHSLDKAATALVRPSTSPVVDLATTAKVAALLESLYPSDAEFGSDLDAALAAFDADHGAGAVRLQGYIDAMAPEDRRRRASESGLAKALQYREDAAGAPDRATRAKALQKAVKSLDAAWKTAVRPSGELRRFLVPSSSWSAAVTAGGVPFAPDMVACSFFPRFGYMDLVISEQPMLKAVPFRIVNLRVRGITGPGTYDLKFTDIGIGSPQLVSGGVLVECPSADDCRVYSTVDSAAHNGTLTITTFDPEKRILEGTFTFNGKEPGEFGGERIVDSGSFRVGYRLQNNAVSTLPQ